MAEGTRLKTLDEAIRRLQEASSLHESSLGSLQSSLVDLAQVSTTNHQSVNDVTNRVTAMDGKLEQVLRLARTSLPGSSSSKAVVDPQGTPIPTATMVTSPTGDYVAGPLGSLHSGSVRLEFPRFDGTNTLEWISKSEQFFHLFHTSEAQKVELASYHLDGPAWQWYQWATSDSVFASWTLFARSLETRFGPTSLDDHGSALAKLTQIGSLADFLSQFELLSNRVPQLPETFRLSLLLSGLHHDIQHDVGICKPTIVNNAIGLARLHDAKLQALRKQPASVGPPRLDFRPTIQVREPLLPTPTKAQPPPTLSPPLPAPTFPSTANLPVQRMTTAEMQRKRELNLCYHCDATYVPGHRCPARRQLFYLDLVDSVEDEPVQPDRQLAEELQIADLQPPLDSVQPSTETAISFHALTGYSHPTTLRFLAQVNGTQLQTLVDGGSTHNFVQTRVANALGFPIEVVPCLSVSVGNGEKLSCEGCIRHVPVHIHNITFIVDLYVVPIHGAELVLGVSWLATVNPITYDYVQKEITVHHQGLPVRLSAMASALPQAVDYHHLRRLIHSGAVGTCLQLTLEFHSVQGMVESEDPKLDVLLSRYEDVFKKTQGLPPPRPTDHAIHLLPGTNPVNVKPYRYPYFQKTEIERLV
ncbi:uncharacterized protein LOC120014221 [Tripterygium wilfordii]|uniref:uncharacterized protein LOC120014221 n=1 Tax=Tripterygium wilfordii TaxID=458696 RepID=UPI0018F80C01|nr:uncharacterized protein LOC120014221 [Tripterygium wilfordii]